MGESNSLGNRIQSLTQGKVRWMAGLMVVVVLTGLAVVILLRDSRQLFSYSFHANPLLLVLSFVVECSGFFVAVVVWRAILARYGGHLGYWDDFRIYSYSMLGMVIPGRIWTAVGRIALYKRQDVGGVGVATASVAEFILMGLGGLLVLGIATLAQPTTQIWHQPGIALAFAGLAILLIQPPIFNRLSNRIMRISRQDDPTPEKLTYKDLIGWLGLESIVVFLGGLAVYVLFRGVITEPPNGIFWPLVSAWAVATISGNLFFWLPGTPVIRDGAMALILAQFMPPSVAILFVVVVRVWTIASILILIFLVWLFLERNLPLKMLQNNQINPKKSG